MTVQCYYTVRSNRTRGIWKHLLVAECCSFIAELIFYNCVIHGTLGFQLGPPIMGDIFYCCHPPAQFCSTRQAG